MRSIAASGFGVAADTSPETIEAYVRKQIESEAEATRVGGDMVSDRVLLDGLAYVETACELGHATYDWSAGELALLRAAARIHAAWYDFHCYIPVEFDCDSDLGFHRGGEGFRTAVARRLERYLTDDWPIPVVTLAGSVEERARSLADLLEPTNI